MESFYIGFPCSQDLGLRIDFQSLGVGYRKGVQVTQ